MINKEIALQLDGITESPYGGFWIRLAAQLLDGIILSPVFIGVSYFNSLDKNNYFYTVAPYTLLVCGYMIYLSQRYGGTPGKLVAGLRIIKINGENIGMREAFLRYTPSLILALSGILMTSYCLSAADAETFSSLSWTKQA